MADSQQPPTVTWACDGPVRGSCGVQHHSFRAALRHCRHDDALMQSIYGETSYSDRRPTASGDTDAYRWEGMDDDPSTF